MTTIQKAGSILWGLGSIAIAIIMLLLKRDAYVIVLLMVTLGFLTSGVSFLIYYFTMSRYMVGGKITLYKGIILMDFAMLTLSLTDVPKRYVLFYLAVIHAFSGMVEMLRAREAGSYKAKSWRLKFMHGLVNIALAVSCIIFIKKTNTAVIIYSIGLVYSGIVRILTSFRKTSFIYIQ